MVQSDIEAYIDSCSEPARSRLVQLRALLQEELPEATEKMSYGMPTWHQGENLVHIAGYAKHVGLYPGPAAIVHFAAELAPFPTSKGAIQFLHTQKLPLALVRKIARFRLKNRRK